MRLNFKILALLLFWGQGQAFVEMGVKWEISPGQEIPYIVNHTLTEDVEDEKALEAVQLGYDVWTLTCSTMKWHFDGRTDNSGWGEGDGYNVVTWREMNWGDSSAALGITASSWNSNNIMQDADIKFNGEHHEWGTDDENLGGGRLDIASVGAHEAGHALGLDHSEVNMATMWPTYIGGTLGRSLSADDIEGACTIYPSGGEVPEPVEDPILEPGTAEFGDDCAATRCIDGLFCLNDGFDLYCSQNCEPGSEVCGEGYYCARLSANSGACARGDAPTTDLAAFGDLCEGAASCQPGLSCVEDEEHGGSNYCTGRCAGEGSCPRYYNCGAQSSADNLCLRGEGAMGGPMPSFGNPCTETGLCAHGFFCFRDSLNYDQITGDPIDYCTLPCDEGVCDEGYRCIEIQPEGSGSACQKNPAPGDSRMGDQCWVDPEEPWKNPICANNLLCIGYELGDDRVEVPGHCTKSCEPQDCCPSGWGCQEITPVRGLCVQGVESNPAFACEGEGGAGGEDGSAGAGGGPEVELDAGSQEVDAALPEEEEESGGGGEGCAQSPRGDPRALLLLLFPLLLLSRRRSS